MKEYIRKEFTINELIQSDWFPYRNRVTVRNYIDSGELKAVVRKSGGIQNKFMIKEEDARAFTKLIKEKYKNRFNLN